MLNLQHYKNHNYGIKIVCKMIKILLNHILLFYLNWNPTPGSLEDQQVLLNYWSISSAQYYLLTLFKYMCGCTYVIIRRALESHSSSHHVGVLVTESKLSKLGDQAPLPLSCLSFSFLIVFCFYCFMCMNFCLHMYVHHVQCPCMSEEGN